MGHPFKLIVYTFIGENPLIRGSVWLFKFWLLAILLFDANDCMKESLKDAVKTSFSSFDLIFLSKINVLFCSVFNN